MNLRLGYACINTSIDAPVNRTCIAKTFTQRGQSYINELVNSNLESVLKILEWNEKKNIKLYRLSSSMFPQITNKNFISEGDKYAYDINQFSDTLKRIGQYAHEHGHRLTFHPGQYNQVGAIDPKVYQSTIRDLSYHADVLDIMGCDQNSVMVVHGGGRYNDKETTIKRWVEQYFQLPDNVKERLVLENCEFSYSIEDTLRISSLIKEQCGRGIPCVFDTHHHQIYPEKLYIDEYYLEDILDTWNQCGIIPKFHISEQDEKKRTGSHSEYVQNIPDYFFSLADHGPIDIMIEAKMKDKAVLKLKQKYNI